MAINTYNRLCVLPRNISKYIQSFGFLYEIESKMGIWKSKMGIIKVENRSQGFVPNKTYKN
jgi:hypothetical protein